MTPSSIGDLLRRRAIGWRRPFPFSLREKVADAVGRVREAQSAG